MPETQRNDNLGWIADSCLTLVKWHRKDTFPTSISDKHMYKAQGQSILVGEPGGSLSS